MRLFLTILLPLLLPSVAYFLYVVVVRDDRKAAAAVPWSWLLASGVGLAMIAFVLLAAVGGARPGSVYHPPREIDGRIEPGYFDKAKP